MSTLSRCGCHAAVWILAMLPAFVAWGHPMDSYAIDQYLDFRLRENQVHLVYRIEFAEIPTAAELPNVDKDSNMELSQEEVVPYVEKNVEVFLRDLALQIGNEPIAWNYGGGDSFIETVPAPRLRIVTQYDAPLPQVSGDGLPFDFYLKHRELARGDRQTRLICEGSFRLAKVASSEQVQPPGMAPPSINEATALLYGHKVEWTLIPAESAPDVRVPEFARRDETAPPTPVNPIFSLNDRGMEVMEEEPGPVVSGATPAVGVTLPPQNDPLTVQAEPLREAAEPEYAQGQTEKTTQESWADKKFRELVHGGSGTAKFGLLFASILALLYGAAHALEPGHGKTVVGAYLVGTHGTVYHAILLAAIVTFTHTFAVYILGILALTNLDRVQGTYLPILEIGSWFLIVLMGLFLFLKYYRYYISGQLADPTFHTHGFGSGHSHAPGHDHARDPHHHHDHDPHHPHGHGHAHGHTHHDHPHPHSHDVEHSHSHHEGHGHSHSHSHPHDHGHEHGHEHEHHHEGHPHPHDHGHEHHHDDPHQHDHDHDHSHDHGHDRSPSHEHVHEHDHAHEQEHAHHHHEDHPHPHDHGHEQGHHHHPHPHPHEHKRAHARGAEKVRDKSQVSFWNLLVLGMTGGIVPCPGALFVMMMALGSGEPGYGLYLITLFSIGLALTLMLVGILMVKGRGAIDRYGPNSRFIQLLPVFSSLVILFVGAGFFLNGLIKHGILTVNM